MLALFSLLCLTNEKVTPSGYAKHESGRPAVCDYGLANVEESSGFDVLGATHRGAGGDGPHDADTAQADGCCRCLLNEQLGKKDEERKRSREGAAIVAYRTDNVECRYGYIIK